MAVPRPRSSIRSPATRCYVRAPASKSQSLAPITSSVEMGHLNRDWPSVIARLGSVTPLALSPSIPTALKTWINGCGYPGLFQEAFGTPAITPGRIAFALAS
jgi:cytochrome c peroxidase